MTRYLQRRRISRLGLAIVIGWICGVAARADVERVSSYGCEGNTCHDLVVECQDLGPREVRVRELTSPGSRGTIILTTGGFGKGRYNKLPFRNATVEAARQAGFEVFQVEWQGPDGWATSVWGAGFRKAMCGYAEVVRWIVRERADTPEIVCSQGNSGGALQNAWGLAAHGLGDVLDMVVMTAGPPLSRVDEYCFPHRDKPQRNRRKAPTNKTESTGRTIVDRTMGWAGNGDNCNQRAHSPEILAAALEESLIPTDGEEGLLFDYTSTPVFFLTSEEDPAARQARFFYELLASEKEWLTIPGRRHQVDNTEEGSAKIVELFLSRCTASDPQ